MNEHFPESESHAEIVYTGQHLINDRNPISIVKVYHFIEIGYFREEINKITRDLADRWR
jgi:hypothetical protein